MKLKRPEAIETYGLTSLILSSYEKKKYKIRSKSLFFNFYSLFYSIFYIGGCVGYFTALFKIFVK